MVLQTWRRSAHFRSARTATITRRMPMPLLAGPGMWVMQPSAESGQPHHCLSSNTAMSWRNCRRMALPLWRPEALFLAAHRGPPVAVKNKRKKYHRRRVGSLISDMLPETRMSRYYRHSRLRYVRQLFVVGSFLRQYMRHRQHRFDIVVLTNIMEDHLVGTLIKQIITTQNIHFTLGTCSCC